MSCKRILSKAVILVLVNFLLISCGPSIYYLGDSFQPSDAVEIFYDAKEIKKEYKIVGRMTNDKIAHYEPELIKAEMVKKAKQVGADAIIFSDLSIDNTEQQGDRLAIKAELIKYQ